MKPRNGPGPAASRVFAANERMNQLLLDHIERLAPPAWTARPPGKVRTIAAIFTHMHNVRTKWIRLSAPHLQVPRQLARAHCTPPQARAALAESAARCTEMLAEAHGDSRRMTHFVRDAWAKPWPVGPAASAGPGGAGNVAMLAYMVAHEAHHRGQVCMLAHQLGFPLPGRVTAALWNWESLWRARD